MKRLLVNADDFGLTRGVTDGIVEAHRRGIVTSTSVIAAGAAFDYAAGVLLENARLGVGVHLTLMEEKSTCEPGEIPTLAGADRRLPPDYGAFLTGLATRKIHLDDVEREMRAQVVKCIGAGLKPEHLDSHQHVHAVPAIFERVLRIAEEFGIAGIRIPMDWPGWRGTRWPARFTQKVALCGLAKYDAWHFRKRAFKSCGQIAGLFDAGTLDEESLLRILDRLPAGDTELVCHPGCADGETRRAYSHWGYNWDAEREALTSPRVRERLAGRNVVLVNYQEL